MIDVASGFRISSPDDATNYRANLQFCCDHYRSVSEVCRRLKLNRQQFNRYLAGTALPSRHNHKLISDFFGLDLGELFTPHAAFAASFRPRDALQNGPAIPKRWTNLLHEAAGANPDAIRDYHGFYFKYFFTYLGKHQIKRELVHWYEEQGTTVSSVKQRDLGDDELSEASHQFVTYRGIVGNLGDRLINIDQHRGSGRELSTMILYPKRRVLKRLNGVMIGVNHGASRSITAARVVMDFLGTEIDIRAAFGKLGNFDADDRSIPASIKQAVKNDIGAKETLFLARS